jgi:peptide/nickel transport system ATP-binding protein
MSNAVSSPRPGEAKPLLEVKGLTKYFPVERGFLRREVGEVKAVDGVSFTINQGKTLGLVGESGCGKTTLGRCIMRAMKPTSGEVTFHLPDGSVADLAQKEGEELRLLRRHFHMIFQDPFASLDPRMTVLDIIAEPLKYHHLAQGDALVERVKELMDIVGLDAGHLRRYPRAFSGGQRQRIGIARSLAATPQLIVCDEAVSALDVSVRAQILNLLLDLQEKFHLTYLFIAHDLAVVEHIADHVAVMYVGQLVEMAESEELYLTPQHPYTEALLSAILTANPRVKATRIHLAGEVANPANLPSGCYFHPRCQYATDLCKQEKPLLREITPGHFVACHRADELSLQGVEA